MESVIHTDWGSGAVTSRALKTHFKTKETLGSIHVMEFYSAVKGDALCDTHSIMADSEGCISVAPFTRHCRKRQNYRDRILIWLLDQGWEKGTDMKTFQSWLW